jgi:hypothetical protein
MASREIRICRRGRRLGDYCLALWEFRVSRDIDGRCSNANSTLEANKRMQAKLRPCRRDLGLAALYRRRSAILMLIRSIECYQRVSACQIQACPRRDPSAAA